MSFSEKIKDVCRAEGINLKQFSELCKIPYSTIKGYSQGKNIPTIAKIHQITEVTRFAKYKNLLLSLDESSADIDPLDAEIMRLFHLAEEAGRGAEALEILKVLAGRKDR